MKILKVFGVVVGIHLFALILIFANPGCSAMTKTTPAPADTAAKADTASPTITVPNYASGDSATGYDPNAPAVSSSIRYSPTRPNTPAAGALESEPVTDVTPASTYTVGKGDSLWSIAHKNNLTRAELAAANNLKSESTLRQGQKLIIPGKAPSLVTAAPVPVAPTTAPSAVADPTAKGPNDVVKHVVKPGETLGAIARKYQVKVGEIATANNISDPAKIRPGMTLIIPGWQAPAGKTAAKNGTKTVVQAPAQPVVIPTISVAGEDQVPAATSTPAGADAPPTITVEDAPPPKKP